MIFVRFQRLVKKFWNTLNWRHKCHTHLDHWHPSALIWQRFKYSTNFLLMKSKILNALSFQGSNQNLEQYILKEKLLKSIWLLKITVWKQDFRWNLWIITLNRLTHSDKQLRLASVTTDFPRQTEATKGFVSSHSWFQLEQRMYRSNVVTSLTGVSGFRVPSGGIWGAVASCAAWWSSVVSKIFCPLF